MLPRTRNLLLFSRPISYAYWLRDLFTTNQAAPLTSLRSAEPGPGTLTITDTGNKLSIASGKLRFADAAGSAFTDPRAVAQGVERGAGRAFFATLQGTTLNQMLGWRSSTGGGTAGFIYAIYRSTDLWTGAAGINTTGLAGGTEYEVAFILRGTGAFVVIRGGAYTAWTLLWVFAHSTVTPLYPSVAYAATANDLDTDNWRGADLPAWASDYSIATQRLAGARAALDAITHTADCLDEWTVTALPSSGNIDMALRVADASNRWVVRHSTAGDLSLRETVGGATFSRGSASAVLAAGHRVVAVAAGSNIRVYSNDALRITYAAATTAQTATAGVLDSLGTGGAVSDWVTWPRDVAALIPAGV